MHRKLLMTCILLAAWAAVSWARPATQADGLPDFRMINRTEPGPGISSANDRGIFQSAAQGTTFFGGTFWAADSNRWEAIQDSTWTFDTGVGSDYNFSDPSVDPYKFGAPNNPAPPGLALHAHMEGWVGIDHSYSDLSYFRRLSIADFAGQPDTCVGTAAGLGGNYSFWCGVLQSEADKLCYASGQGYGNLWNICIHQSFNYDGSGNPVNLQYDYRNDSEPTYDYTYVLVDTSGAGDFAEAKAYTGTVSGHANLNLTVGVTMRSDAGPVDVQFCFVSDSGASDEDGFNPTECGGFAVDNVALSGGGISSSSDFESGAGGWSLLPPKAGPGGDWSNIASLSDLPAPLTNCECDLVDSVLVLEDLSLGGHNVDQNNVAVSPWIDLKAANLVGAPGKFLEYSFYTELPFLNYVFMLIEVQWYPQVCPNTGKLILSPFTTDGFVTYFGDTPLCTTTGTVRQRDPYGSFIDPGAEQLRVAFGVVSYCGFFSDCSGVSNSTPWIDNVRVGVFGNPEAPYLATTTVDTPQDAFPENGTLRPDAPGRIDCNEVLPIYPPTAGSSLGDTLIVRGGTGGSEVRVQFSVRPGPRIDSARLASWLAQNQFEEHRNGLDWYSARMDTSEAGGPHSGVWMTAYHESDPNFSGSDTDLDPNDLPPSGSPTRLANDIFPDDLFTPGTRVNLFYKARYIGSNVWFTDPDTSGGAWYETEVMPSSMAADSTYNCVLYVDHFDGRGAQPFIESALGSILPGGSSNSENTAWDRFDVRAPDSQQGSFGRPLNTEYGATVSQVLGYKAILWNTGNLDAVNLSQEDGNILIPWLTLSEPGLGFDNLYLSGNDIAQSISREAASAPSAERLLTNFMGVSLTCGTVRSPSCPPSNALADTTACIPVDPVTGATVAGALPGGRSVQHLAQGNGCPQLRSFDVLQPFIGGLGAPVGDESYNGPVKGTVDYASVINDVSGGPDYKTVVDGISVHYRRDPSNCSFTTGNAVEPAVEERLREVLTWFGYAGNIDACTDPTAGTSVPVTPRQPAFKTALANFAPNPLLSGTRGTVQFTMAQPGKAAVDVFDVNGRLVRTIFDGVAGEGVNTVHWDGTDSSSRPVASGVYFYRLRANGEDYSKKLVVVRNGS